MGAKTEDDLIVFQFKKPIKILPLSDLHIGSKDCKYNEIKRAVNYIKSNDNIYYTLGGDLIDNGIASGKMAHAAYENNMNPEESINYFCELFKDISDKCLCIIPGNHEDRSTRLTGLNPANKIAVKLGIEDRYRNCYAVVKVRIGTKNTSEKCSNDNNTGKIQTYTILVHHGQGNSETAIKKAAAWVGTWEGIDICITGHVHEARFGRKPKRRVNKNHDKVKQVLVTYIVTNSFLGDADYAKKNMLPCSCSNLVEFELLTGCEKSIPITYY